MQVNGNEKSRWLSNTTPQKWSQFYDKLTRSENFLKNELLDRIFVCKIMSWVVLI